MLARIIFFPTCYFRIFYVLMVRKLITVGEINTWKCHGNTYIRAFYMWIDTTLTQMSRLMDY